MTDVSEERRWLLPVGVAVVVLVVAANAASSVGVGTSGKALVVTLGVSIYTAAALIFLFYYDAPARLTAALLLIMGAAATATHVGDPTGTGGIGLYLGVAYAPLRLPQRSAMLVAGLSVTAFDVQLAVQAANPVVFIIVVTAGAAFFFLFGVLLDSEQRQRRRADRLVAELERSREAERAAAALAERARLSREMHDVLAHTLSGLVLKLEALAVRADRNAGDERIAPGLAEAHRLAKDGLEEARAAVQALRGTLRPGPDALRDLVADHRTTTGTECELIVRGEPGPLDADASLTLYRTVQEGLANVRKHAAGARVSVVIDWRTESVAAIVEDHGGQPDETLHRAGAGLGLAGMAERAALVGGRLQASPTKDGFRLSLEVPRCAS